MRGPAWFAQKAGRRDANHATIRDGLEALNHFVIDLASVGDGVVDLEVFKYLGQGVWSMKPTFLELKTHKGKLRASQVAWRERAASRGLRVRTATTLEQALAALL